MKGSNLFVFLLTSILAQAFEDLEPPICNPGCPKDIVKETEENEVKVSWAPPKCTDNSKLPPRITESIANGAMFRSPNVYKVEIKAEDNASPRNVFKCTFLIKLKMKSCPMYPAPRNGALKIQNLPTGKLAFVSCQSGFDFASKAPYHYACASSGDWVPFGFGEVDKSLPWPDCAKRDNPSWIKTKGLPSFFYSGDCNDRNVQMKLKAELVVFLGTGYFPPGFCTGVHCTVDNMKIYCGKTDVASRRRR